MSVVNEHQNSQKVRCLSDKRSEVSSCSARSSHQMRCSASGFCTHRLYLPLLKISKVDGVFAFARTREEWSIRQRDECNGVSAFRRKKHTDIVYIRSTQYSLRRNDLWLWRTARCPSERSAARSAGSSFHFAGETNPERTDKIDMIALHNTTESHKSVSISTDFCLCIHIPLHSSERTGQLKCSRTCGHLPMRWTLCPHILGYRGLL